MPRQRYQRRRRSFGGVLLSLIPVIICIAALAGVVYYRIEISDYISGLSFTPTTDMQALHNSIKTTPRADLILRATHPTLDQREDFARNCKNEDVGTSVLGCYTVNGRMHIYDIRVPELEGIRESTLAHELLHAVYSRLPLATRNRLEPLLRAGYEANKDQLYDDMQLYTPEAFLDELHSRLGTEVDNLPPELEQHYARFFTNRPLVLSFYHQYAGYLAQLKAERDQLQAQINELRASTDSIISIYRTMVDELQRRIDQYKVDFDNPAFSQELLVHEYNLIQEKKRQVNAMYDDIIAQVNYFNELVERFNNNIIQLQAITDAMSSAPSPPQMPSL